MRAGIEKGLGGSKPKGKHKLTGMHLKHAANGGYIAKHEVQHEDGQPGPGNGKEHIHPDMEALLAAVQQHMQQGGGDNEQAEPPGAEEPEPAAQG